MIRRIAIFPALLLTFLAGEACGLALQIGAGDKAPVIRPPKRDKKKELPNQALEELPRPPLVLSADATKLSFLVAPLSNKGLLSQQSRDGLKFLISQARGAQFVRIRAFVAGSGDLRRVPQLVSETFADKHLSLPVVVTVQVGALPLEGAQVQLEATLQQGRTVNASGVRFVTADAESSEAALAKLKQAGELLRATCFVPSVDGRTPVDGVVWIQPQRSPAQPGSSCEGVARNAGAAAQGHALAFTGAQIAFSYSEEDARLAYERLEKTLKGAHSTLKNAVYLGYYPLSSQLAEQARRVGSAYLPPAQERAGIHNVVFEGLPAMDGSFAVEAIATVSNPN